MPMIFSKEKWNGAKEISVFVPASASLSFSKMEAPLSDAQQMFLLPLVESSLMERIEKIYAGQETADKGELQLLAYAQRSVANLAFWYHFDALNLRISDQGFQRQGSGDWQGAYKYQEDRMRDKFKNSGFNALDALLDFVEDNIEKFPEYKETKCWKERSKAIVRSPKEVDRFVCIYGSHIVFMRLQAEFRTVEEYQLRPILGDTLYLDMRKWLDGKESFPAEPACSLEDLRLACADYVVRTAVARLVKQTGSLTDRGLYFQQTESGTYGNDALSPASDRQIGDRLAMYEADAARSAAALTSFINNFMGGYVDDSTDNGNIRDNNGHNAFFTL